MIKKGTVLTFDTHGGDSEWMKRDGQPCTVLRPLTEKEADIADVGPMYHIRFSDGVETDAFEDELIRADAIELSTSDETTDEQT